METLILGTRYPLIIRMKTLLVLFLAEFTAPMLIASGLFATVLGWIDKYLFTEWEFLLWMTILVVFDTATGMFAAWRQDRISSKKMVGVPIKIGIYGVSLSVTHIMSASIISKMPDMTHEAATDIAQYFDCAVYCFMMFREALSINENLGKVGMAFLPKFLMKKMQDFDEKGNFNLAAPVPTPVPQPAEEAIPVAPTEGPAPMPAPPIRPVPPFN